MDGKVCGTSRDKSIPHLETDYLPILVIPEISVRDDKVCGILHIYNSRENLSQVDTVNDNSGCEQDTFSLQENDERNVNTSRKRKVFLH